MVGWSALSSDRAHPLFSAHTAELPPDPQQGACRFAPGFSLMSCLCKSRLWERHKMNTKTQVQAWPANAGCMSWDLVSVAAVVILFYCISIMYTYKSPWTRLVHSCPRRQQKPRASGWVRFWVLSAREILRHLYLKFFCTYLKLKFN
uniref:Uncharacterized protein n=1 Tax=Myotis myotis TaxID=51298 RepID=A0A7J7V3Y7_MYOMY|nr:hypothetical protein mMyoMyo1_008519 [Myotis myotis]